MGKKKKLPKVDAYAHSEEAVKEFKKFKDNIEMWLSLLISQIQMRFQAPLEKGGVAAGDGGFRRDVPSLNPPVSA